jgi:hypothetical protein
VAKRYRELKDDEKARFWEIYFGTRDSLRFAIIDLTVAAGEAELASEASAILAEKLRLESELAVIQNHSTAVATDAQAITPPGAPDVSRVKSLAGQVDRATVDATTFRSVVQLADEALQVYGRVKV